MQHLDEGTIHAWLDGELPFAERESAELHMASCAECAAAVAEARGFIAASSRILTALDAVPGGVLPAEPVHGAPGARRLMVPRAWMAVAAVLVLGIGTVIARRSRPDLVPVPVAEDRDAKSNGAPVPQPSAIAADTTQVAAAAPPRAAASDKPQMSKEALQKPAGAAGKGVAGAIAEKSSADVAKRVAREEKDERAMRRDSAPTMLAQTAPASEPAVAGGRASPPAAANAPAPRPASPSDSTTPKSLVLSQVVVTGAGKESANDVANGPPRVVSRTTATVGTDTIVTTVYQVRGVRVSLIDRPHAVELLPPVKSGFTDAVMAKARSSAPAENSITWSDSTGRAHTLRGAMSQAELERVKAELFGATP